MTAERPGRCTFRSKSQPARTSAGNSIGSFVRFACTVFRLVCAPQRRNTTSRP